VHRVPRRGRDLLLAVAWPARRYRCRSCGWEGLQLPSPQRSPAALRRLGATAGVATLLILAAAGLLGEDPPDEAGLLMLGGEAFGPGEHFDGVALPEDHPLVEAGVEATGQVVAGDAPGEPGSAPIEAPGPPTRAGLALRRYCAWGDPGRSPYLGTPTQALRAAGLPDEVVERVAGHIRAGRSIDRVSIRRGEVRGEESGLRFDARRIALTYGTTMCLDSAVNFPPGRVEHADLFVATDDQGHTHYVMIPDVCGNVSVLRLLEPMVRRSADPPVVADAPVAPPVIGPMADNVPPGLLLAALPPPGGGVPSPRGTATASPPGSPTLAWLPGGGIGSQGPPRGGRRWVAIPPPTGELPPDQSPPPPEGAPSDPEDPPGPPPEPPPDLRMPEPEPPKPPFPPPPPPLQPPGLWPGPGPDLLPPTPPEPPRRNYRMSEPGAATLGVVAMTLVVAAARRRRSGATRLLGQQPERLWNADIQALEVEEHYTKVHTSSDSAVLLTRFSDAITEREPPPRACRSTAPYGSAGSRWTGWRASSGA
jgi:hypothetical protein